MDALIQPGSFVVGVVVLTVVWFATRRIRSMWWRHSTRAISAGLLVSPAFIHGHGSLHPVPCYYLLPIVLANEMPANVILAYMGPSVVCTAALAFVLSVLFAKYIHN